MVLGYFLGDNNMKTMVFKKIIEKRCKILEKKIFETYCTDAYEFIDLDVAILLKERAVYREVLAECQMIAQREEKWQSLSGMIDTLLEE